jgi:hypothetical protein
LKTSKACQFQSKWLMQKRISLTTYYLFLSSHTSTFLFVHSSYIPQLYRIIHHYRYRPHWMSRSYNNNSNNNNNNNNNNLAQLIGRLNGLTHRLFLFLVLIPLCVCFDIILERKC